MANADRLIAKLTESIITPTGREIAAKVAQMMANGLAPMDALAVAAELGIAQGHVRGVDAVAARMSGKNGELPR